jgi:hypothetical protein
MKTMLFGICCLMCATLTAAQQDSTSKKKQMKPANADKYCVVLNEGKTTVTANGKILKADIQLPNGNKLTASGTVVKKDGTVQMIRPGSCVNTEGNEIEQAEGKQN